ncbi:bifunctional serine/threonine-protein kinase/transporter substrate-binding domain-containing protein [Streptomyces sp. NPDC059009]|uniref:bifunctional serine/threonine-protein kinase/transporter substrate-binding domain-containing protein n=1 Tax=Streptomyces sp. NPDC059009 TaxID=3346694 RepID=UPI00368662E8
MRPLAADDPRQIGPFQIIGVLGGGGMGRVYLGRTAGGRTVAVKTAHRELADDPHFRARFAREVAAARQVGGPFVAPVVDAEPHGPAPWMATDYVPGISLTDAVSSEGPLPEPSLRLLATGLAEALTAIHAQGLVHRDLKPSNVLLTADGPRVIDFGIAHSAVHTALTQTGAALGTPGYMAPEQVSAVGPAVTGAADVFALGGVLFYAATGGGPYGAADPQILLYRTVHEEPRLDRLPFSMRTFTSECLAKNPADRPSVPRILAALGPAGPYDGWLPAAVTNRLLRLSATILGSEHAATAPGAPTAPPAPPPTTAHKEPPPSPGRPAAPYSPPAPAPAPGPAPVDKTQTAAAAPPPLVQPPPFAHPFPTTPSAAPSPPRPAPRGLSRRRALTALSLTGVVGGGGALAWALSPDDDPKGKPRTPAGNGKGSGGSGALFANLPEHIREKKRIAVGSDISYAPMEFTDTNGKVTGFDVDLANALGKHLGVRFEFATSAFDSLIPSLNARRFDVVLSAMADTEERRRGMSSGKKTGPGVDFVDYLNAGVGILVMKGNPEKISTLPSLCGKKVVVQRGTIGQDVATSAKESCGKPLTVTVREMADEAVKMLQSGTVSAFLCDYLAASQLASTTSSAGELQALQQQFTPEPVGMAVRKDDTALRDALKTALARVIKDGTYAKLLGRWGIEAARVERAAINGG